MSASTASRELRLIGNANYCKEIVVNEAPFDEQLYVFNAYMIQLAKYVDNMHNVIIPQTGNSASRMFNYS